MELFIVTKDGRVFSDRAKRHEQVAFRNNVPDEDVVGGGFMDETSKKIFGDSQQFGPYDPKLLKSLYPDWEVEEA